MPALSHVAVTVTDLSVSEAWYTRVFGAGPVLDEDTGPFRHIVYSLGGTLFGLHGFPDLTTKEPFDERIPGLDHVSFGVASRAELVEWAARLDDYTAVPPGQTVVQFRFRDVPAATRDWWLVISTRETDVCDDDPGYPVAVTVTGSLRRLTEVWRGDVSWPDALRSDTLAINGPVALRQALPGWFTLSDFAPVTRPA